ncbi:MAG TPA: tetratricopeptide repeat protein [Burkholderiaceae bacterium]|nr:tetratricopeptide repeat protein [Burkholderiaceae bacterium]
MICSLSIRRAASWLPCMLLAACAAPPVEVPDYLLRDELFAAPVGRVSADDLFALSDEMRRFANTEIAAKLRMSGRPRGLFEALYSRGHLRVEYDAAVTRTASQAFAAEAGNCLSLAVMTAAFAKELGIRVRYQAALDEAFWSRSGDLYVRNGHVNLMLGSSVNDIGASRYEQQVIVDFLPPEDLRGLRTRPIGEPTVVAMYMNNRATESLVDGRLDDAYWWVRGAIHADPGFDKAYNTLGVIYHRHNDLPQAERAFRYVLERHQASTAALSNLTQLLLEQRRGAEADALHRELARFEPDPPFFFFNLGQQAMARGDFKAARDLFAKEVSRDPYYHEFHFWLAVADFRLGDNERARKHLELALENSTTRRDRDLYAAKLAWIRAHTH